jgi:hypothetical protein
MINIEKARKFELAKIICPRLHSDDGHFCHPMLLFDIANLVAIFA